MARMLVAGAAGFLGSHLVDRLLGDGHSVLGVDNLCTGDRLNLDHLANEPRFAFEEQNICQAFTPGAVDYIFNLASPASPPEYLRMPVETLMAGSAGTHVLLEIARTQGASFFHASTSECYGDPLVHPQPETYWGNVNPIGPRSVYDESKRFSEALTMAYHRSYNVDTHLARIFNTYGPRLRPSDGRVISTLLTQALHGDPLTIYGNGGQTRSFCYVSDLIEGILRLSRSEEHYPINLGNPAEYTILECANVILDITGSDSGLRFEPLPEDDPTRRQPDIGRARSILKWEPTIALRDGLLLSVDYFRGMMAASGPSAARS